MTTATATEAQMADLERVPELQVAPVDRFQVATPDNLRVDPECVRADTPEEIQVDPGDRIQIAEPVRTAEAKPIPAAVQRKTWREQRAARRRRRVWLEEVLAWILVPVIVLGTYWFVDAALAALGTSPSAIFNGLNAILSAL